MEFQFSVILIVFLLITAYCQMDDMDELIRKSPKKYCGNHLVQALQTICRGNYNTLFKQDYVNTYLDDGTEMAPKDGSSDYPFKPRAEATSMLGTFRTRRKRYNQGVYSECCQKTCTREELSSYCAVQYKRKR